MNSSVDVSVNLAICVLENPSSSLLVSALNWKKKTLSTVSRPTLIPRTQLTKKHRYIYLVHI
jgi:hypothetical protein